MGCSGQATGTRTRSGALPENVTHRERERESIFPCEVHLKDLEQLRLKAAAIVASGDLQNQTQTLRGVSFPYSCACACDCDCIRDATVTVAAHVLCCGPERLVGAPSPCGRRR
jgi:hypothetical protein